MRARHRFAPTVTVSPWLSDNWCRRERNRIIRNGCERDQIRCIDVPAKPSAIPNTRFCLLESRHRSPWRPDNPCAEWMFGPFFNAQRYRRVLVGSVSGDSMLAIGLMPNASTSQSNTNSLATRDKCWHCNTRRELANCNKRRSSPCTNFFSSRSLIRK